MTASRIAPHLYQGGVDDLASVRDFDVVVLCAIERQFPDSTFPGVSVYRCPLDDAELSTIEWKRAVAASAFVAPLIRGGRRCLVTCQQGRNRSGLVSALTMHRLMGWSGHECVAHVKARRENALTNDSFVAALARLPDRRRV
jgi:protein-tyrosine phosphatase